MASQFSGRRRRPTQVHAGTLKRSESEKPPIATTTEGGESPCPEEKCERAIKFLGVAALKATGVDDEINMAPAAATA